MLKRLCVGAAALAALVATAGSASGQVVISQIYAAGGSIGGVFNAKYIELFNKGSSPQSIGGWMLRHSTLTAGGTNPSNNWSSSTAIPAGVTLEPGQYYLVRFSSESTTVGVPSPVSYDHNATTSPSIFNAFGAVALMSNSTAPAAQTCVVGQSALMDYVNWRTDQVTSLNCVEVGSILGSESNSVGMFRKQNGCTDTDNNPADWVYDTPSPRNTTFNGFVSSAFSPPVLDQESGASTMLSVSLASVSCNSLSAITSVTADLSLLGASSIGLVEGTPGVWSTTISPGAGQPLGIYYIPITVSTASSGTINTKAIIRVKPTAPINDTCNTALPLSAANGIVDNRGADNDQDNGTCGFNGIIAGGVWYTYTPSQTEVVTFVESGTQDVAWGWFTGTCAGLTNVACFNNDGTTGSNQTRFQLLAGNTYYLLVGSEIGYPPSVEMNLSISITPASAPANDSCTTPVTIPSFPFTTSVNAEGALQDSQQGTCAALLSGRHGVWYRFTVTNPGLLVSEETSANSPAFTVWQGTDCNSLTQIGCSAAVRIETPGTYLLQVSNANTGLAPTGNWDLSIVYNEVPVNDVCTGAVDIGTTFPLALDNVIYRAAYSDADISCNSSGDTSLGRGMWYKFTAPVKGAIHVKADRSTRQAVVAYYNNCTDTVESACASSGSTSGIYVRLEQGQTAYFVVGENLSDTTTVISTVYNIDFNFAPESNAITCGSAFNLNSVTMPFTHFTDWTAGTDLDRFPCSANGSQPARHVLYYSYTPAVNGQFYFNEMTAIQNGDWRVYVAQNQSDVCNSLVEVLCNTNEGPNSMIMEAGRTYLFFEADSGTGGSNPGAPYLNRFNFVAPPAGDTCATANVISTLPFSADIAANFAYLPDADVTCNTASATSVLHGVWYTFTPASNMAVTLSETSSTNIVSALYTGCGQPALVCRTHEDAYYELTGGQTYYILVGADTTSTSSETSTNPYQFTLFSHNRLSSDACADAVNVSTNTFTYVTNLTTATSDAPSGVQVLPTPAPVCNTTGATQMRASMWLKMNVQTAGTLSGTLDFDRGTASDGVYAIYTADAGGACPTANSNQIACGDAPEPLPIGATLNPGVYYMQIGIKGTATAPTAGLMYAELSFSGTYVPTCIADFDQNGIANIDDIFIFLNAWFAGCNGTQSGPPCLGRTTDTNGDGINIDDIFIFLNLWFQGC